MLLASQIAGVLNQPFLQNKVMKHSNFLHVNASSQKLKLVKIFFVGYGQSGLWTLKLTVYQE